VAEQIYSVVAHYDEKAKEWRVDLPATERRREEIRRGRKQRGVPFRQWWEREREKILEKENMASAVLEMWRTSMELSPDYGQEIRDFWQLPEDFTF
jgi:N-methylhydantoinase B/acetone carboxylase alpha subunit